MNKRQLADAHNGRGSVRRGAMLAGLAKTGITIAIALLFVFSAFWEIFFLPLPYLDEQLPAPRSVRAPYDFSFDAPSAYNQVSGERLKSYSPIFQQDEEITRRIVHDIDQIADQLSTALTTAQPTNQKIGELERLFNGTLNRQQIIELMKLPKSGEAVEVLRRLLVRIVNAGLVNDEDYSRWESVQIIGSENPTPRNVKMQDCYTHESALEQLVQSGVDFVMGISLDQMRALAIVISRPLRPNLTYLPENQAMIAAHLGQAPKGMKLFRRGEILIRKGQIVTRMDQLLLRSCAAQMRHDPIYYSSAVFFMFSVLALIYLNYNKLFFGRIFERDVGTKYIIILLAILLVVLVAKLLFLFTDVSGYAIPLGVVAILTSRLIDRRIGLLTAINATLALSLVTHYSASLIWFYTISSAVCVLATVSIKRLWHFLPFSLGLGLFNTVLVLCTFVIENKIELDESLFSLTIDAFLGGAATWILAFMFLPVFEKLFGLATEIKLHELEDLNHVLLSELRNQAPGTYHHSIAVGNLASVAAEAISADPLLTRVGGYYHDVGKLSNPTFFMENLPSGDNPHVGLTPQQSIEIIKGHVTHGVEIAKRSRLPESIIKFIREHHGTTMLEFFYYKSMKDDLSRGLPESLFRYVGDKPSGPESALIMIADSVEAISRVVPSMTEEKARAIIEEVIRNKLLDGQFDNVELTAADFRRITEVMVKAIIGTAHQRKGYPELQRSRA